MSFRKAQIRVWFSLWCIYLLTHLPLGFWNNLLECSRTIQSDWFGTCKPINVGYSTALPWSRFNHWEAPVSGSCSEVDQHNLFNNRGGWFVNFAATFSQDKGDYLFFLQKYSWLCCDTIPQGQGPPHRQQNKPFCSFIIQIVTPYGEESRPSLKLKLVPTLWCLWVGEYLNRPPIHWTLRISIYSQRPH